MNAYLMYAGSKWWLCFGDNPVEASKGITATGIDDQDISVSQGVRVLPRAAHAISFVGGGVLIEGLDRATPLSTRNPPILLARHKPTR